MKRPHWLDFLEYASLFGFGAGAVATLISKQLLYVSAPLSLLVLLNLANRRRLEHLNEHRLTVGLSQLDCRLSKHIELLNQQVMALPTPEAIGSLKKSLSRENRESLDQLAADLKAMQQEVHDSLKTLDEQKVGSVRQEIGQLQQQYSDLCDSLATINSQLHRVSPSVRVEEVEGAIAQIKSEIVQLQVNLQSLNNQTRPGIVSLQDQVNHLNRQFQKLPPPYDPNSLRQEVGELIRVVSNLVPKRDLQAIADEVQALYKQQEILEKSIKSDSGNVQSQIKAALDAEVAKIQTQLKVLPTPPQHELIFDFKPTRNQVGENFSAIAGSDAVLKEALETTQDRLILIWPWAGRSEMDDATLQNLSAFLAKGRRLDLGWCYLIDHREERFLSSLNRRWMMSSNLRKAVQDTLHKLLEMKQRYPEHFQFKILGTRENFLVSDQNFAVLGIHNELTTSTVFSDLTLKLRTTNAKMVQQLTARFENPVLAPDDIASHWNRAVTRHDLGDHSGAIADLNQIVTVNPDDALAFNQRGVVRYEQGDRPGAVADFCESIALHPRQVAAYCNRGFIRAEMGDDYGAIADYSLAIQSQPEAAIAYFYRGLACQKLGNDRGALADFSEAMRLAPDSAVAHYYRGTARQRLGYYQGAIADLETSAHLFSDQGSAINAQKAQASVSKTRRLAIAAAQSSTVA